METNTNNQGFPIQPCTRCNGTGEHSYNSVTGRVCFQCNGTTLMIAPHAKKAWTVFQLELKNRKDAQAGKLAVGDLIARNKVWCEVKDVSFTTEICGSSRVNGEIVKNYYNVSITVTNGTTEETFTTSENHVMRRSTAGVDVQQYLAMIKQPKKANK